MSQAETRNTSRRRFLQIATAAAPALAIPAAVSATSPLANGSLDAELITLGHEFDRLALVLNDCFRRSQSAHDQAQAMMIEVPDALRPTVGDGQVGLRHPVSLNVGDGLYGRNDVGYIRRIDHPRAREIVQAYALWLADRKQAFKQSGYDEIQREIERQHDAIDPIMERIIALPAHTIEGMKIKARVTFYCDVGDIMDDDEATDRQAAMSIVKDLLRMQGTAPMSDHEYARVGAQQLFGQTQTI